MTWILDRMQLLVRTALGRGAAPAEADTAPAEEAPADEAPADQLALGHDAEGRSYVLNLATGGIESRPLPAAPLPVPCAVARNAFPLSMTAQPIPLTQLTTDRIHEILCAGGYAVEYLDDGRVLAQTTIGPVLVQVHEGQSVVQLRRIFSFRDDVSARTCYAVANRLNTKGFLARYYYVKQDSFLVVEHDLVGVQGVEPPRLLATLRLFTSNVEQMLITHRVSRFL